MWWTVLVSFGVAVLSGLGVGSAGLLVVFLTAVEKMPQLAAQGLNLVFFLFSSGAALVVHMLRTPLLFGCILLLLVGGIPGSFLGTAVAHAISEELLRRLFGFLLIASGAMGLLKKKKR
ncbi:MAG: sulfite exporter TauE/SafE family protein [Clostridia bacterium]|nr:sulfite exporter TauE/SafE family protein [Clostridia bacterium]